MLYMKGVKNMAKMIRCKTCGNEIASSAKTCPNCGGKNKKPVYKAIWFWAIVAIAIIAIAGNNSNSNNNNSTSNNNSASNTKEKFSYTISKQYSDTFSYYVEGIVTNNKDKNYSYVQIEFICYDANGNNLGTALDNTNNL